MRKLVVPLLASACCCIPSSLAATTYMKIGSCDDLLAAAAATSKGNVVGEILTEPIECEDYTTVEITANRLKLVDEMGLDDPSSVRFFNVRFLVSSGTLRAELAVEMFPTGLEDDPQELNGGLLYVARDATARFTDYVYLGNLLVINPPTGEGGCIHNEGVIRIDGSLGFGGCSIIDNTGSMTVDGGGIWNGETGKFVVKGGLSMGGTDAVSSDPYEGRGGGIYNKGKFTVHSWSGFDYCIASVGGGLYNDGSFNFVGDDTAFFVHNSATGQGGGSLYNAGQLKFKGGVYFGDNQLVQRNSDGGAIINTGSLTIKGSAEFSDNQCQRYGGAIFNSAGASLDLPDDAVFEGNYVIGDWKPFDCDDIFFEGKRGYTCGP